MRPPELLSTSTFRLSLIYLVVFAASVFAVLFFINWTPARFMALQTDQTLQAEIGGLEEQFERRGFAGLVEVVAERSRETRQSFYLVTDPARRTLAGNLPRWPDATVEDGAWIDFSLDVRVGASVETHPVRARQFVVRNAFGRPIGFLLVGRDIYERQAIERRITNTLGWAAAFTLGLGLVGGLVMSRNMLRRLDTINRTARKIRSGDLGRRVPLAGVDDEIDQVAANVNAMMDQIERLMTAMQHVTDNIAHDLRSPVNRLRARIEVALMQSADAADLRRVLEETIEEADRILATFNALLDIARIESATEDRGFDSLDAAALARDVAELYEPVCEAAGHTLRTEIAAGARIKGNRELLSRALSNLLDNAIKYTPAPGIVTLRVQSDDGETEVSVCDTGPGIAEQDRTRVLERFVRLGDGNGPTGSGLGLSLVSAVARAHGAALRLSDRPDGQAGLCVALRFGSREAEKTNHRARSAARNPSKLM